MERFTVMPSSRKTAPLQLTTFMQGVRDCLPTLLGYVCIGFAAGMIGVASGLTALEIALMSGLVYAGAAQFIMCSLLAAGSASSVIIMTIFIVNARHFLLCATLAPSFKDNSLLHNIGIGALVTDETFGVASSQLAKGATLGRAWMNGLNLTAYLTWIISCVAGGLVGYRIADPQAFGFDFALPAMFIALLIDQLRSTERSRLKHRLMLVLCMAMSMYILSYVVPSHLAVLLSTLIVATIGVMTEQ